MTFMEAMLDAFGVPTLMFLGLVLLLFVLLWAGEEAVRWLFGDWRLHDRRRRPQKKA